MPGERVAVPADGELRLTTAQTSLAVTVPPAVRDSVRYLGNGIYYFGSGEGAKHTIVGSATGKVVWSNVIATPGETLTDIRDPAKARRTIDKLMQDCPI